MNVKKFLFLILLLLTFSVCMSRPAIDSLRSAFYSPDAGIQDKITTAEEIAEHFIYSNPDSAAYYANQGMELSFKNDYTKGIFRHACMLGRVYMGKDELNQAVMVLENAILHIDKLDDKRNAFCAFLYLGYIYDIRQEYYKSHKVYFRGLHIAEEQNDSSFLYSFYNNLGSHFLDLDDYARSMEMFQKALTMYKSLSPDQIKFPIASVYNNLGQTFNEVNQLDSAKWYFEKALSMPEVGGNYYGLFILNQNLGDIYMQQNQLDSARLFFSKSEIALDSLEGNFIGTIAPLYAMFYNDYGQLYFELNQLDKAMDYSLKAIEQSKLSSELSELTIAYRRLATIYERKNNLPLALKYQKQYAISKDSLQARQSDIEITRITLAYEYERELEKKQLDLELMDLKHRKKETLYIFAFITAGGIIISLFLLFFLQRTKARKKSLEEQNARLEKEKVAEELEYKNKELTTNVLYMLKKNELIATIAKRLREVTDELNEKHANKLNKIIIDLNSGSSKDTWQEFEMRFKEVHTDFYNRLSKQFPGLSPQEYRLCAFLRLNMTNKEIAAITYQTTDSLKAARYRLRKKMGLNREDNLINILTRL